MTDEQIKKLAEYVEFLRNRLDVYYADGNEEMINHISGKLEAVREVSIIFDCRVAVFGRADKLEEL